MRRRLPQGPGPDLSPNALTELSSQEARWLAIDAQGLSRPRPAGRSGLGPLRKAIAAVGTVQLDAINVLERTQRLVLFSRIGAYDVDRFHGMTGPGGELFEYWGHAASLQPATWHPLFRWRMSQSGPHSGGPKLEARRAAWWAEHREYIAAVLAEVTARGPLAASALSDPRPQQGEWWDRRSVGRRALEWLFGRGQLAAWRTPSFERVYDLPERVIPAPVLAAPTPAPEEAHRQLLLLAAGSLGVATVRDMANYYRLPPTAARQGVTELVEAGALAAVKVEGWREPGYVITGRKRATAPRRPHATLLSPFDSLIWERARTERLFGFDYRIEVYVPEPDRTYGYYVLPLLLGDRLVARFDLKADRKANVLRVQGAYVEAGEDAVAVAESAAPELEALASWRGLSGIAVARRGNLASAVGGAVARL